MQLASLSPSNNSNPPYIGVSIAWFIYIPTCDVDIGFFFPLLESFFIHGMIIFQEISEVKGLSSFCISITNYKSPLNYTLWLYIQYQDIFICKSYITIYQVIITNYISCRFNSCYFVFLLKKCFNFKLWYWYIVSKPCLLLMSDY